MVMYVLICIGALQYTMLVFGFPSPCTLRQYEGDRDVTNVYNYLLQLYIPIVKIPTCTNIYRLMYVYQYTCIHTYILTYIYMHTYMQDSVSKTKIMECYYSNRIPLILLKKGQHVISSH